MREKHEKRGAENRIKAFIFDMDGVIVDSMPYHFISWYEALRPFGVRVSCFDVYSKEGEKWTRSLREFFRRAKVKCTDRTIAKVFEVHKSIFKRYFKRYVFSGAADLLKELKRRGYLLALVTGNSRKGMSQVLPAKIRALFDYAITDDEVKKGKPHPEPYMKAAEALRANADECIVIENAPFGIESAKAAGMFCIGITTSLPKQYLKGADIVIDRLEQLAEAIKKIR